MQQITVRLPPRWVNGSTLEQTLRAGPAPFDGSASDVHFHVPSRCNLMTEAAVRLLSLLNQLDHATRQVIIDFEDNEDVLGYLNRIGFFEVLSPNVCVLPKRPTAAKVRRYRGSNPNLVEIERIDRNHRDGDLPKRLTEAIGRACENRRDVHELEGAAWTILAELIDNVFDHSETKLDGFAALQVYPKGNCLKVAVSDSGHGLLSTLRPALKNQASKLAELRDVELLVEVFRQGLSRHGAERGCGLKGCADKAIKFGAELDVRLPQERVLLVSGKGGFTPNRAYCYSGLPLIWGTHICFKIDLD